MRIGIDIDDVVTNTSEIIEEFIDAESNSQELKKHIKSIMKGNPSDPEIVSFCKKIYLEAFRKAKAKDNVSRVIKDLFNNGNEIFFITARGEKLDYFKGSEKVTKEFLEQNNIEYTKILFNATDKAKLCLDNKIDLMIDDSIEHCEDVRAAGIKSIVFNSRVNKDILTAVERVDNWLELEEKILGLTVAQ